MGPPYSVIPKIRVLSYNIHKGFSGGISRFTLHRMREGIRALQPDILFLQEVHGEHNGHGKRIKEYPRGSQFEYLAELMWPHFTYGKNAAYFEGHHGNAILSKFPILSTENIDISQSQLECRGILHAKVDIPGIPEPVHALCTHLGLLGWHRSKQIDALSKRVIDSIPVESKIIAAGDFNDWRKLATSKFEERLDMIEAFSYLNDEHAKTFPSWLPFLCLDRVYVRGFQPFQARVLNDPAWTDLSDHLALWVELI